MEHFKTRNSSRNGLIDKTYDFSGVTYVSRSSFYSAGCNRTASGNGEYVFNGKKERFNGISFRGRDIAVDGIHKLKNALAFGSRKNFCVGCAGRSLFKSLQSRTSDNRAIFEALIFEGIGDFHFDELEKFGVVHLVAFVEEYNDIGNAYLTGKQNVLSGLRHRTVGRRNYENRAVHLSGTRNHILNVVRVSRAVNVCVVTFFGLILYVSRVNRNTASLLFGSFINLVVFHFCCLTFTRHNHSDSCGQSGLAVVNVADCADVNVGLAVVVLSLCHFCFSL